MSERGGEKGGEEGAKPYGQRGKKLTKKGRARAKAKAAAAFVVSNEELLAAVGQ
jgi:hypothetical protein